MTAALFKFYIVGLPHHAAPQIWHLHQKGLLNQDVSGFIDGLPQLELRPEPTNKNDPNAIQVVIPGHATTRGTPIMLGYIGKDKAVKMQAVIGASKVLTCALETEARFPDPASSGTWRGYIMTDAIPQAASFLKPAGFSPTAGWLNPKAGGAASPLRPRSRTRLVHDWF